MGVFKKLRDIKEPDITTPATPAPQGVDETEQESVDTKGGGLRKRKARGKRDLQIPTTGLNTGETRGNGVNV
jgi:hypothetical protein